MAALPGRPRRPPGRRRRTGGPVAAAAALLLLAGYAAADAADVVPGVLTTAAAPRAVPALPQAPGARASLAPVSALPALSSAAPTPDPAVLASVVGPLLGVQALAGSAGATVLDAATGKVLLDSAGTQPREPASVTKLMTATAVLAVLGADATLSTRVVAGAAPGQVVLVGGGDVLLSAGAGDPAAADGHAGLADLADATATALRAAGTTGVTVQLDDTLTGSVPQVDPTWGSGDVGAGYAAPLSSLAVDAGRTRPGRYSPRVGDPAMAAATTFAQLLGQRGVAVTGAPARTAAPVPASAQQLAEVRSAPLSDVIAYALAESDNTVAEALARQVGAAAGRPPVFAESAAAVLDAVARLGVDTTGAHLVDGSGLGDGSTVPPAVFARVLAAAAGPDHPALRPLLGLLPVGGLTGTLGDRFLPGTPEDAGAGVVRAKTGSLTGVTSLVGTVVDADGRQLVFAVLADRTGATAPARAAVDAVADALVGCGCR